MKKHKFLKLITAVAVIVVLGFTTFTNAGPKQQGENHLSSQACFAKDSVSETITEGMNFETYFTYCYRVACSNGKFNYTRFAPLSGANSGFYKCRNGNTDPYVKTYSDGCSSMPENGSCNTANYTYCTKVIYVDCKRKKNGSAYTTTTTTQTKPSTATTATKTSSQPTQKTSSSTKKTTTTTTKKKTTSGKKTTGKTNKPTTSPTKTSSSTSETTTETTIPTIPTITDEDPTEDITTSSEEPTTEPSTTTTTIKLIDKIFIENQELTQYSEDITDYDVKVRYGIEDLNIDVSLVDSAGTWDVIGNQAMQDDEENTIVITAVGLEGEEQVVNIHIIRYSQESDNCDLADLFIEGYNLDYSKTVHKYKLALKQNVKSLNITPTADDQDAKVEVIGNKDLKNNSKITIEVTSTGGSKCTYTIQVTKSSNGWKIILILVIMLALVAVAGYSAYKYLRKSKNTYKYE